MNDIALSGAWTPIGNGSSQFYGKLDGNSRVVSGLSISSSGGQYLGLFGYLASGSQVTNLGVTGATLTVTSPQTFTYIGIIAGYNGGGTISGSYTTGSVSGGNHYNGGIAGRNTGTISSSYSTASVGGSNYTGGIAGENAGTITTSYSTGTITCGNLNGGITGMNNGGTITDSYSRSTISGSNWAGGAVGYAPSGTITNIYSAGAVTASTSSGGLVGQSGGSFSGGYWDTQTSGWATSALGTGKTTTQMKTQSTFSGWDFSTVWSIDSGGTINSGYPYLAWQVTNHNPSTPTSLGGASLVNGSASSTTQPALSFTLSDTDSSDTVKYQIQIDDTSDFSSPVVDYTSALAAQGATSFTVGQAAGSGAYTTGSASQTLSDGSYYWRVKAIDNSAASSSYVTANSGAIAFKVDTVAPSTPGTPSTTGPTQSSTPTWSWTASTDGGSGVSVYVLQWSTAANFSSYSSTTTASNTYTMGVSLSEGTWYFRVAARDAANNTSSYTSAGSVVVDQTTPTKTTLIPANGGIDISRSASLVIVFSESVTASAGNVSIYKSADNSLVETMALTSSNVIGTGTDTWTITPTGLLDYSTSYYIKIDAGVIADGAGNAFSGITNTTTWKFTTLAAPVTTANTTTTSTKKIATTPVATTSQPQTEDSKIVLNTFTEYADTGKKILLTTNQKVYFNVGEEQHSATVNSVGADYAVVTLASTPRQVTLGVGSTGRYDVNHDGIDDIEITLASIVNGHANLTFRQLASINHTAKSATVSVPQQRNYAWVWFVLAGVIALLVVIKRRKRTPAN